MQPPLIPLNEDHKWKLLSEILNVFDSRNSRQILSRRGILPLQKSVSALKIVLLSMFFSSNVSYAVKETEERESLRKFLKISTVPSESEMYTTFSQYDPDNFSYFVLDILNELCPHRKSGSRGIIIDSTDINLNLNWHAKKISKNSLEDKEYKWGYSTHRGFFIGMKLTLDLEYSTLKHLMFLLNEANVPEARYIR